MKLVKIIEKTEPLDKDIMVLDDFRAKNLAKTHRGVILEDLGRKSDEGYEERLEEVKKRWMLKQDEVE